MRFEETANVGPGLAPRLSKLATHASAQCGPAALLSKNFTQRCHSERSEESRSDSFFLPNPRVHFESRIQLRPERDSSLRSE